MFSFGTFSSIIPFIILAITYFAGLTSYSLTFTREKVNEKNLAEKHIQIDTQKNNINIELASFTKHKADFSFTNEKLSYGMNAFLCCLPEKTKTTSSPPFSCKNFERSLYMRPPPTILFS
jgi:hypothetical protein